jgi:hypothetical protein
VTFPEGEIMRTQTVTLPRWLVVSMLTACTFAVLSAGACVVVGDVAGKDATAIYFARRRLKDLV